MTLMRDFQSRTPVSQVLRDERVRAGVKQTDLAARLGMPQSFISKYEMGERNLDFVEVLAICAALDLPVNELIDRLNATPGQQS